MTVMRISDTRIAVVATRDSDGNDRLALVGPQRQFQALLGSHAFAAPLRPHRAQKYTHRGLLVPNATESESWETTPKELLTPWRKNFNVIDGRRDPFQTKFSWPMDLTPRVELR